MFRAAYRRGLSKLENEVLRHLRRRGFALALFPPSDVGSPMNRKPIEDSMVRAGKQTLKQMEVRHGS
jgi:hypothetical protein